MPTQKTKPRVRKEKEQTLDTDGLSVELALLHDAIERMNSFPRKFLLGMVHGIGTGIGATIIAAVIIYLVIRFLHALGLDGIIEGVRLDELGL